MPQKNRVIKAIILAGGYSRRMNLRKGVFKQLIKLGGKPLVAYTLDVFEKCKLIAGITLVVHKKIVGQCARLIKKYGYTKIEQLCLGGGTRQQSVFNALRKLGACDYVVIHDGARPLLSQGLLARVIKAVQRFDAVSCAVKAVDTIVEAKGDFIEQRLSRKRLWHIQTPQAFKFALIWRAHRQARRQRIFSASDDAQLLLNLKKKVKIVEGSYQNIKVTTRTELHILKNILGEKKQ